MSGRAARGAALLVVGAALAACSGSSGGAPAGGGPAGGGPGGSAGGGPAAGSSSATTAQRSPQRSSARPPEAVTLAFGGDVHFEGASASALTGGLRDIAPVLSDADLTVVNLETAVTTGGQPVPKTYVFRAPPRAFAALRDAGVDVATLANNHGMDYGVSGLHDTLDAARAADFPVVGIGTDGDRAFAPHYAQVRGSTVAVIGATQVLDDALIAAWTAGPDKPGLASAKDEDRLLRAVSDARRRSDTVVVYLHWGRERTTCPLDRQQSLARRLVDAGADVVVGSHAHVLLGGGFLDRAYVDYGLGNFVFYARGGLGAETGVLRLTVRGREVSDPRWTPARISGGVPHPLTGQAARAAAAVKEQARGCTGLQAAPAD